MRGSPSCVIAVRRSVAWRLAVGLLATLALASLAAWAWFAASEGIASIRVVAALAGIVVVVTASSLLRLPHGTLRWDGACWTFAEASRPEDFVPGELEVAIDLGTFLLLRLRRSGRAGRRALRWIAVERHGLEREWHAFRCAVYSPRPVAGTADAADPRLS